MASGHQLSHLPKRKPCEDQSVHSQTVAGGSLSHKSKTTLGLSCALDLRGGGDWLCEEQLPFLPHISAPLLSTLAVCN